MNAGSLNNLIIILMFGALILLAFLKFVNPNHANKKANFWFGLFLLVWSTFSIEEIVDMSKMETLSPSLSFLIHYVHIYMCVFFYLSIVFYVNPNYKFQPSDLKHFIIPLIYLAVRVVQSREDGTEKSLLPAFAAALIIFQSLLYTGVAFMKIRKHHRHVKLFSSDTSEIDLSWLQRIIIILFVTSLVFAFYSLLNDLPAPNSYVNFIQLAAVFFIAYYSLKQKEIYPVEEKQRTELIAFNEEPTPDLKRKIVPDESITPLKQRLERLMVEERPYLDSELNLVKLADLLSITSHQLSYVLNTGFNENFFQYINKYRVEKAKDLLISSDKNNLTILGIAFESGFNSKTSFNTTFKKITNQTPSEFKKGVPIDKPERP